MTTILNMNTMNRLT